MRVLHLAIAYLASRPLLTALHVTMLALGVGTLCFLLVVTHQAEERITRDARSIDLVVGAKGSPLQLILSTVFHADVPTGNIGLEEARPIATNPMVASATPVALGDSFHGYRIVGTDASFLALHDARLAQGRMFSAEMEAVVGSAVARHERLGVGDSLTGAHGLAATGPAHAEHPYRVVGILAPTGTVADRLVLASVESVWHVHAEHAPSREEITALLIRYKTPLAAAMLPRAVNATTAMQAASPAYEAARLLDLVGVGVETLQWFAVVLMASAAISLFVALTSALQDRRYDLALLRTLGARPVTLAALTLAEGMTLLLTGVILGFALGHGAAHALGSWLAAMGALPVTGLAWAPGETLLAAVVLSTGALTCLFPAWQAYASDPAGLLARH